MFSAYINFFNKLPVWPVLFVSGICVIMGDFFGKYWSENQNKWFFILSVFLYSMASVTYLPTLLKEGLTITSVVWSLISMIGFLVIGLMIFKESLTTIQIIAVVFGITSLVLFSLGK